MPHAGRVVLSSNPLNDDGAAPPLSGLFWVHWAPQKKTAVPVAWWVSAGSLASESVKVATVPENAWPSTALTAPGWAAMGNSSDPGGQRAWFRVAGSLATMPAARHGWLAVVPGC